MSLSFSLDKGPVVGVEEPNLIVDPICDSVFVSWCFKALRLTYWLDCHTCTGGRRQRVAMLVSDDTIYFLVLMEFFVALAKKGSAFYPRLLLPLRTYGSPLIDRSTQISSTK